MSGPYRRSCSMLIGCREPVAYALKIEHDDSEWLMCAKHTAEMRSCDPLSYIEAVRSLRPSEAATQT